MPTPSDLDDNTSFSLLLQFPSIDIGGEWSMADEAQIDALPGHVKRLVANMLYRRPMVEPPLFLRMLNNLEG